MLKRYPHKAAIVTQKLVTDENGMAGNTPAEDCEIETEGRYEAKDSFRGNYTGKFYMPFIDACLFAGKWERLKLGDREFEIVDFSNHQTHTELWLR